ncbi:hypothetical protein [Methanococcoides burtonii]|uniref:Uncharacterized protein n=1 Tax=Methanococcoides burtonii (strain DSM 6242 / NBRC 107633 / OCM 468 / ACE-M) TaxID=259564 RepID=Q12YH2_METBU|nr:hypothetical protein [Methanococcoides burtonii]ABE51504.1 Hypothetical protein Mbur_0522 [Methanococcoides burtonii DSM 6242]
MIPKLYFYSLGVWVLFIIPAILNGISTGIYAPYTDELLTHQISSVIFCMVIFAVTYFFMKSSGVSGTSRQFIYVGLIWLRLTIFFEFLFGHFHHPIIEDYEVLLLSPGSAIVPGVAEPSAIELDIFDGKVKGRVIRCDGDVCSYFEYERK